MWCNVLSMWRLRWHFTRQSLLQGHLTILKLQSVTQLNTMAKSMMTGTVPSSGRSGTAGVVVVNISGDHRFQWTLRSGYAVLWNSHSMYHGYIHTHAAVCVILKDLPWGTSTRHFIYMYVTYSGIHLVTDIIWASRLCLFGRVACTDWCDHCDSNPYAKP